MNGWRNRIAVAALLVGGCSRTSTDRMPPALVDAATDPEVAGESARDVRVPEEAESSAGSSNDTGSVGACGSGISFQIVAALGVDPGSFCTYGCNLIQKITFTSGSSQVTADDIAQPNCVPLCDACDKVPACHSCVGINQFPLAGVGYDWDGSYRASATCGAQACRGPQVCAPAGHYIGEFCALRGTTVSGRCTPSQGLGSQDVSCSTVEFDLPSTATFTVELGP